MKTELVLLLILDVFKSTRSEFRHHQIVRYTKENYTAYTHLSNTDFKINEEKKVTEVTNFKEQWTATLFDENKKPVSSQPEFREKILVATNWSTPTTPTINDARKSEKSKILLIKKKVKKINNVANNIIETDNTTTGLVNNHRPSFFQVKKNNEKNITHMSDVNYPTKNKNIKESSNENQMENEKIVPIKKSYGQNIKSFVKDMTTEIYPNLNEHQKNSDIYLAEPLVALTGADESDDCETEVVQDFMVSEDVVAASVLTGEQEAKKLMGVLGKTNEKLNEITDLMESTMKKHSAIISISLTSLKEQKESKISHTVYRKGNKYLVDHHPWKYPKFPTNNAGTWTPLFKDCRTKSWIFGRTFVSVNESKRTEITVYFNADTITGNIDQCHPSFRRILNGGPKCDAKTTQCLSVPYSGFRIGGYGCGCRHGYYFPNSFHSKNHYFSGFEIEKSSSANNSGFRCLPCPEVCPNFCSSSGECVYKRNSLLKNSILSVQIFCILVTFILTILVFKHRKCKTIATGMWTIMEMILLGSIFLYSTIIIRAFDPSTIFCLMEPWCREMGFVLCYGAIILKLYRILIEFRTRKAHRWVIKDKDLLKYLFGMIIVVFGYMSAWTATNLYLIQKENYSILTMGTTPDGIHFKTCKAVWWDYVTETGEILILIFGVHLSYASRNATTQFRERCFLCISISVEALVSGIFYILRCFYWETEIHPDLSFISYFTRCQLTTTIVLILLFTPKWWYQKMKINRGRVSRNYLMQESGKAPLEAFKPRDGVTATNSDVEGEISLADMNPEDIRAELKRLYTQLEVLKNKTIRFDNPHISKRRGGRKIAHRRFSLQKKGSREKALRQQSQRLSSKLMDIEITEAEASRTPEDSVCSNEGPCVIINDGPSDIIHMTPKKIQK